LNGRRHAIRGKEGRISDGRIVHTQIAPIVEGTVIAGSMFEDPGNGVLKAYEETGDSGSTKRQLPALADRDGETDDEDSPHD
jgi:hypothetical protein